MLPNILTVTQERVLGVVAGDALTRGRFVLSGGTALAGFYLGHRYSEDLDFFSTDEVDPMGITVFLKSHQADLGFDSFEYQQSMNRNLYFLKYGTEELKMEFTYFPFAPIEPPHEESGLRVDSMLDIAVNKLFTIYQRTTARDYIDLYMLCQQQGYSIDELLLKARVKFDWHIDLLQLGTQFSKVGEAEDFPRMIIPTPYAAVIDFFMSAAQKLGPDILQP